MTKPTETATLNDLWRLWFPPALSGLILTAEIPLITAFVARGSQPAESLAAFGVALSVIVLINSPALALASTTAAFSLTRQDARRVQQFAGLLGLGLSMTLAVLLLTPVGGSLLESGMGLTAPLTAVAIQGLWPMVLAPIAVSWRRYFHGLLIRVQATPLIAYASGVRMMISVSFAMLASVSITTWPSVVIGTLALMLGAIGEAAVLFMWSRRRLTTLPEASSTLSLGTIFRFHLPLAGTTLLALMYLPVITAVIARAPQSALSLAAWPVLYGLISLIVSPTQEIEPITVSMANQEVAPGVTRTFGVGLGVTLSLILFIVIISPLASLYFQTLSGLLDDATSLAIEAGKIALIIPFLYALRSWLRGILITKRRPNAIQIAVGLSLLVLVGMSLGGQFLQPLTGLQIGTLALACAVGFETVLLWGFSRFLA
jgi:hypothetical protein